MRRLALAATFVLAMSTSLPAPAAAATVVSQWGTYGSEPFGLTVDPGTGLLYVANNDHLNSTSPGTMAVIDPAAPPSPYPTTITFPTPPTMSVIDPALGRLFVTTTDGTLAIVDVSTRATIATLPGKGALGIALDPASHRVYASWVRGLSAVDGTTGAVVASASAPATDSWWSVALDPARHRVYVTDLDYSAPAIVALDDRDLSVVGRVALPEVPRLALAVDAVRGLVYVGGFNSATGPIAGHLYAIDETTLAITKTADVGLGKTSPFWATYDAARDRIYVSNIAQYAGELVTVDATAFTVVDRTALPWQPGMNAVHPDGRIYVTGFNAGIVAALTSDDAPVVDSVAVAPAVPRTNDLVTAVVGAHDPDGDTMTFAYRWYRNGVLLAGETGPTLDLSRPGNGDRGDRMSVAVTASDGMLVSADTGSSTWSFTIANTAPTVAVALNDTTPGKRDVVVASATAADADADPLMFTYTWRHNGTVVRTATTTSTSDSYDLRALETEYGDVLSVDVVASDGSAQAAAGASATITLPKR